MARTQEERKAETRGRLLAAAADLFARRGFHAVSTDAVAEAADRTSGAVYAHFGGKDGLLLALLDRWEGEAARRMGTALGAARSDEERWRALWEQFLGAGPDGDRGDGPDDTWLLLEHELFLHAARDPEIGRVLAERYERGRRGMGDAFDAWSDALDPHPALEGSELAVLVMALLLGLEMQRRLDPRSVPDGLAEAGLARLFSIKPCDNRKDPDMKTELCERLGIEFPIFAFTHCRDVVAAVSNAGGLGVLGAVGFSPEQLAQELDWIDDHVGDRPYGVDTVIPGKYEGMGELDPEKLQTDLEQMIPEQHRTFARQLYAEHGVPELPEDQKAPTLIGWTLATAAPQIEVALEHPNVKLIANALGTPPPEVVEEIHGHGRLIAALCGSAKQALSHKEGGLDVVIAQGTEAGGHTGEIGSMVLWPEVIDAVAPLPVLAAGGIGTGRQMAAALAMGAQGVWTGSIWLTVEEADVPPAQMKAYFDASSRDTVRSRSWTGKPCRMLRNDWTDAWERPDTPSPLGMPLQFMVTGEMVARHHQYADKAQEVGFNPVGQIVGRLNKTRRVKDVIYDMVEECIESSERLSSLLAADS